MKKTILVLVLSFLFLFIANEAFAGLGITGVFPNAYVLEDYSGTLTASGGTGSYSWSLKEGTFPPGLGFSSKEGETVEIIGTPEKSGAAIEYNFTIRVIDDNSGEIDSREFSLFIRVRQIESTTLVGTAGTVGEPYSFTLGARYGITPYIWEARNIVGLAEFHDYGLGLSSGGEITGVPCRSADNRWFGLRIYHEPAGNCDEDCQDVSTHVSLTFSSVSLEIITGSLPSGEVGKEYIAPLSVHGGKPNCYPPPYSWSIGAGELPAGLNLSGGAIAGIPSQEETKDFTVVVTDSQGDENARNFSIKINPSSEPGAKPCAELGGTCCPSGKSCSSGKISGALDCLECCGDIDNCVVGGEEEEEEEEENGFGPAPWGLGWFKIENPLTADTFEEVLDRLINFIFWVGITVAPVMLIIAGFMLVTAMGDPKRVETAKKMILYTLIGLAIVILAKGLIAVLKSILGVATG